MVGQIGQTANQAVGQATEQAGRLLEETVNESGQTVQRVVDESGSIVERTLNESGEVLDEAVVGDVTDTAIWEGSTPTRSDPVPSWLIVRASKNVLNDGSPDAEKGYLLGSSVNGENNDPCTQALMLSLL